MAALPFCHVTLRGEKPKSDAYPKEIKSLGDHLRTARLDRGLLQKDVARLIGVTVLTITNWERNATEPELRFMPTIIDFLGAYHEPRPDSLPRRLVAARRAMGLSQREAARRMGVDPSTLARWERGERLPSDGYGGEITKVLGPID